MLLSELFLHTNIDWWIDLTVNLVPRVVSPRDIAIGSSLCVSHGGVPLGGQVRSLELCSV